MMLWGPPKGRPWSTGWDVLRHLTSSFAAVIITTPTKGCSLTINVKVWVVLSCLNRWPIRLNFSYILPWLNPSVLLWVITACEKSHLHPSITFRLGVHVPIDEDIQAISCSLHTWIVKTLTGHVLCCKSELHSPYLVHFLNFFLILQSNTF